MALTGRAPALLVLGLLAVWLQPTMTTVRIWWLFTLCAIGLDMLLALSPRRLSISRDTVQHAVADKSHLTTASLRRSRRLATFCRRDG